MYHALWVFTIKAVKKAIKAMHDTGTPYGYLAEVMLFLSHLYAICYISPRAMYLDNMCLCDFSRNHPRSPESHSLQDTPENVMALQYIHWRNAKAKLY